MIFLILKIVFFYFSYFSCSSCSSCSHSADSSCNEARNTLAAKKLPDSIATQQTINTPADITNTDLEKEPSIDGHHPSIFPALDLSLNLTSSFEGVVVNKKPLQSPPVIESDYDFSKTNISIPTTKGCDTVQIAQEAQTTQKTQTTQKIQKTQITRKTQKTQITQENCLSCLPVTTNTDTFSNTQGTVNEAVDEVIDEIEDKSESVTLNSLEGITNFSAFPAFSDFPDTISKNPTGSFGTSSKGLTHPFEAPSKGLQSPKKASSEALRSNIEYISNNIEEINEKNKKNKKKEKERDLKKIEEIEKEEKKENKKNNNVLFRNSAAQVLSYFEKPPDFFNSLFLRPVEKLNGLEKTGAIDAKKTTHC